MNKINERLVDLIDNKLKISRMQFSKSIGHGQSYISNILRLNRNISVDDLLEIEKAYKICPMYLLKGENCEHK